MPVAVAAFDNNLVAHCNCGNSYRQKVLLTISSTLRFWVRDGSTTVLSRSRGAERVLIAVSCLTIIFVIAEFVGGCLAHSIAIMTDAGHMMSDLLGFIISITAIRCSRRTGKSLANKRLSFGWERAEILGALISVIIVWILTTMLIVLSIERIIQDDLEVNANVMLITAGVGVLFNVIMGAVLHFGHAGHSHHGISHGHSHGTEANVEAAISATSGKHCIDHDEHAHKSDRNVNVRAALIHVVGDLLQSFGVLIAALIIKFTGWNLADPICTFLFAIIVLFSSLAVLRDIFFVLMEATPNHIDFLRLQGEFGTLKGVLAVHSLHVWSINMEKTALTVHIAIEDPSKATETIKEASRLAMTRHNITLATVQVELFDKVIDTCYFCQPVVD